MKKLPWILALLFFVINIALVYVFVFKGETFKLDDGRRGIPLNEEHKAFALDEMRTFLESVKSINEGITFNKKDLVIAAGEKSGGSVIEHSPQGFMKKLPMDFKALGFATHAIFDEIADSARVNFQPLQTRKQLDKLLGNCVACHREFKVIDEK